MVDVCMCVQCFCFQFGATEHTVEVITNAKLKNGQVIDTRHSCNRFTL